MPPIFPITTTVFPCCTTTDSRCFRKLKGLASPADLFEVMAQLILSVYLFLITFYTVTTIPEIEVAGRLPLWLDTWGAIHVKTVDACSKW